MKITRTAEIAGTASRRSAPLASLQNGLWFRIWMTIAGGLAGAVSMQDYARLYELET